MERKLYLFLVLAMAGTVRLQAQQEPQFTHYMFDKLVYNPAAAGMYEGYFNLNAVVHNQWTNFHAPEGERAPVTQTAEADMSFDVMRGRANPHHIYIGAGANVLNDKEGFIGASGALFSGAIHYYPNTAWLKGNLSLGFNAGFMQKTIDPNWKPAQPGDPLLAGRTSYAGFDAGVGMFYDAANWYVGLSALHLPATRLDWQITGTGAKEFNIDRTCFLTAGYYLYPRFLPNVVLNPSIFIKQDIARLSYAATCLAYINNRFWAGLNYRSEQVTAASVMVGAIALDNPSSTLRIGYSYDFATQIPTAFGGTHELSITYRQRLFPTPPDSLIRDIGVRGL